MDNFFNAIKVLCQKHRVKFTYTHEWDGHKYESMIKFEFQDDSIRTFDTLENAWHYIGGYDQGKDELNV